MQALMIFTHNVASDFIKHKARSSGLEVYTLNELSENISYIIDDISPEVILISEDILELHKDLFEASLKDAKHSAKTICLHRSDSYPNNLDHSIQIPFEPDELIKFIVELSNG